MPLMLVIADILHCDNTSVVFAGVIAGIGVFSFLIVNSLVQGVLCPYEKVNAAVDEIAGGNLNFDFHTLSARQAKAGADTLDTLRFLHRQLVFANHAARKSLRWIALVGQELFKSSKQLDRETDEQEAQLKQRVERGETPVEELLKFVRDWLIFHIQGSDRKYAVHFHARDVR